MRPVSPLRLPPRLPPVARGACAVVKEIAAPLPEPVALAPAGDAPLQEVLAVEAAALADIADPSVLAAARREARAASLVANLDGVIRGNPLEKPNSRSGCSRPSPTSAPRPSGGGVPGARGARRGSGHT
ncbi:hypothetical protein [Methylobacterium sp. B1]|uniref:hypothetical protein n=1 Tax=Methylobacterium sp. B1 TaxID=91459 RepID=UPI0003459F0B|nr:hypothetical protein [Methylobacterium sp. B1]